MPHGADWVAGFVARSFAERPVESVCGSITGEVVSLERDQPSSPVVTASCALSPALWAEVRRMMREEAHEAIESHEGEHRAQSVKTRVSYVYRCGHEASWLFADCPTCQREAPSKFCQHDPYRDDQPGMMVLRCSKCSAFNVSTNEEPRPLPPWRIP